MATEVKIKVTADTSSTKAPIEGLKNSFEDVETASDKAGNALKDVDRELGNLDKRVTASRMELKRLAHEFANVDDEAQKIDISKAMAKIQRDITQATRARKALTFEIEPKVEHPLKLADLMPQQADTKSTGKLAGMLTDVAVKAGTKVGPILGSSIGLAAAPMAASTIAGAIIGGVGLGGIAGGFAVAKNDARVKSAIKDLGDNMEDRLEGSVRTFVPAAVSGIKEVEKALGTINFAQIFGTAALNVGPVVRGVSNLIEDLGNGIEDVSARSGPATEAIANGLSDVGEAAGEGLSSLADNGEEAAASLEDVFDAITVVTEGTFGLINQIMEVNGKLREVGLEGAAGINVLKYAMEEGEGAFRRHVKGADAAAEATTAFKQAAEELSSELKEQTDPVFALVKAQDDLEASQEAVTKATKKFGRNSPEAKQALRDLAMNALETQAAAGKLGDTFDGKLTPELRATLKAAGMTKGEIGRLEKQFREAKREGDRFSGKYQANLALQGDRGIKGRVASITDDLRAFDGVWTATMVTNYIRHGKPGTGGGLAHGGIKGAANGSTSNGLTLVGEHGPELAEVVPGGRVWSNPDTQRMLRGGGEGAGQRELLVSAKPSASMELMDVIVRGLRYEISNKAGGNAQRFLGQGAY